MTLFESDSQYREKLTIWRVLSSLPLYGSLAEGHIWRWFAINIPMDLGTGGEFTSFPPEPGDLAITFVDWNPLPPDKGMGLWRDVSIAATGPVAIRYPVVTTHLTGGLQLGAQ